MQHPGIGKKVREKQMGAAGTLLAVNCDSTRQPHLIQRDDGEGWTLEASDIADEYEEVRKQGVKDGTENLQWIGEYEVIGRGNENCLYVASTTYNQLKVTTANDESVVNKPTKSMLQDLKNLPATLRRVFDTNMKTQYRAGLRNEKLELTQVGKDEILHIIATTYEEALTKRANEIIAEHEE